MTTQKHKQQCMKTTNISKTIPNETEAYFRSLFMPSNDETNHAYSTSPSVCTGQVATELQANLWRHERKFKVLKGQITFRAQPTVKALHEYIYYIMQ